MKQNFKFKIREIIDLLIEFVYLAIIFIVPLYFSVWFPTYNTFELAKLFIFKTLVLVLVFLSSIKFIFYCPEELMKIKKYLLIPLLFISGLGISLFFSSNITQSFFGSYDRQAGYLSYLFYFIWFILLIFNVRTLNNSFSKNKFLVINNNSEIIKRNIKRIIAVIVASGSLVAIYGILQILGIDFLVWPESPLLTKRAFSTLGQPNFLASWILMVIPLSIYLFYENKKLVLKFLYFLSFLLELACLFFTSSRGAMIAFCLTIILAIIYLLFFAKFKKKIKIFAGMGLLLIIVGGLWAVNLIIPGRITSLANLNEGSSAMRVSFYQAAADSISKKPAFGYGLENEGDVFISYYQPDWGVFGIVSASTDKAHNLILDILLASGFFGLALYVSLYYYFFSLANKNIVKNRMSALSLSLLLGVAAYLFSLLFDFSIVSGEIYFWLFLALIVVINFNEQETIQYIKNKNLKIILNQFKLVSLILISSSVIWGINYEFRVLISDHYFNKLYYTLAENQYSTALLLSEYIKEEKANPINQNYYDRFLGEKLSDFYPNIEELVVKRPAAKKLAAFSKDLAPDDFENIFVKAKINSALGNYLEAEKYFRLLFLKSPYWPKAYAYYGDLLVKEKKLSEAIINYQLLLKILPNINDSRLNDSHKDILKMYYKTIYNSLGDIYFSQGNYLEAEKYFKWSYLNSNDDYSIFKKIADTYYLRGDYSAAIKYNLRGSNRSPLDYNWPLAVSMIYKQQGNKIEAKKYFDQAFKLAPTDKSLLKLKATY